MVEPVRVQLHAEPPVSMEIADSELAASKHLAHGESGAVHSWELVTAVDGPGTRLTVFMAGCALACQYCHNPDTWRMRDGKVQTVDEVMGKIRRYETVLKASHGGVTFSGGEPLLQAAFIGRLLEECKKMGIHTTLDTSGFLGARASAAVLKNVDLVLLDVKSGIPETYKLVTGRSLQPTLDFGRRLSELSIPMWVRFVVVPGLTDAEDNVEAVAEYLSTLTNVERVEVLPFHQMGRDKWRQMGVTYPLQDVEPPTPELTARVRGQFEARGFTVY